MVSRDSLYGWEFDFLVVDSIGRVAALSSAGYGPIPADALDDCNDGVDFMALIDALPVTTPITATIPGTGHYEFWTTKAERGLFSYDWKLWRGPYVRIAAPRIPISIHALTDVLPKMRLIFHIDGSFEALAEIDSGMLGISPDSEATDG